MEEFWNKTKIFLVQFTHFKNRNKFNRYGLSLTITILIFLLKLKYHDFLGDSSIFLLTSFAVATSSLYGGLGPGLLSTFLTALTTFFILIDIEQKNLSRDIILSFLFFIEGTIISVMSEARFQIEEQKNEFIGFAGHELKNPLSVIKGFSGLILNLARKNGEKKIFYYAEEINSQIDKIIELINDLLDITKIEIGKFTYSDTLFNFDDLTNEVIARQKIISKNRSIEIKGKTKKMFYGDRYRIGQAIVNLLTNAIKYSPQNKKIIVKLKKEKNNICLSVKDYGIGVSKSEQRKIFEPFYRAAKNENKSLGLGLGLHISSRIVKRHKGRIWLDSTQGRESVFYVELPTTR